jgi:hypothetical protein
MEHIDEQINRNLVSKNKGMATKFIKKLQSNKMINELHTQILNLESISTWDSEKHREFERIDTQFTDILTTAEKECKSDTKHPWSLDIHIGRQTYRYWRTASKGKANRINTKNQLKKQEQNASDPNAIWQGDRNRPIKNQLKRAISNLLKMEADSKAIREAYLVQKHSKYKGENKNKIAKIIRKIQKAERKTRCHRTCKNINKPRTASGGLTHVLITESENIRRIDSRSEVEGVLHKKIIDHFAQAKNTPFAKGEIATLLNTDGVSDTTTKILEGVKIRNVPDEMAALFTELKRKREPLTDQIPFQAMVDGFHKWRESTATSPSGKHLGIYKTLTHALKKKYDEKEINQNQNGEVRNNITDQQTKMQQTAQRCLTIQHRILNLAIKHQHTLERWKTVQNVFIEKIPGDPRIEKLRVIHIYEADWTLTMKYCPQTSRYSM